MGILKREVRKQLEYFDQRAKYKSGLGKIDRGECPLHRFGGGACLFCRCGHMLECHFPLTCEEAQCSHIHPGV